MNSEGSRTSPPAQIRHRTDASLRWSVIAREAECFTPRIAQIDFWYNERFGNKRCKKDSDQRDSGWCRKEYSSCAGSTVRGCGPFRASSEPLAANHFLCLQLPGFAPCNSAILVISCYGVEQCFWPWVTMNILGIIDTNHLWDHFATDCPVETLQIRWGQTFPCIRPLVADARERAVKNALASIPTNSSLLRPLASPFSSHSADNYVQFYCGKRSTQKIWTNCLNSFPATIIHTQTLFSLTKPLFRNLAISKWLCIYLAFIVFKYNQMILWQRRVFQRRIQAKMWMKIWTYEVNICKL